MQGNLTDAAKAEIARRERERLKLHERLKKEKLERMRLEANDGAGAGEVNSTSAAFLRFAFASQDCFVKASLPGKGVVR